MGIPKFYGEFIRNKTSAIKERYEGKIASLSIDLNGIIHNATQKIFAYGAYDDLELRKLQQLKDINVMYNDVYHKVTSEIRRLYDKFRPDILVVAVDGVAPLAKIDQQRSRRYINALTSSSDLLRFDSAAISPGTDFMIGLDKFLQEWFAMERNNLGFKLVYSSHLIPGEGEHKILDLMRSDLYDQEGLNLFHGADADLYMLSLVSPLKNIWIVREDVRGTNYIDIETLKLDINKAMLSDTAIQDFVILAFLLGNDFVPHIFSLNEVISTLDNVMLIYKQIAKPLVNPTDGRINFEAIKRIMASLAFGEATAINRIAESVIKHPHPALEASRTADGVDYQLFKDNWYRYNLVPKRFSTLIGSFDPDEPGRQDIIKDAANAYYMTLEWVWLYYSKGVGAINLDWYYPYNFTPLLTDMIDPVIGNDQLVEADPVHKFYHPLQQMFMIFNPKSSSLIPFGLGALMTHSDFIDLYPIKCEISQDGYNTDWQKDILLPPLDPQRIADLIVPESVPNLNQKFPFENELFIDVRENLKRKAYVNVKPKAVSITPRLGTASTLGSTSQGALKRPLVMRRP